MKVRDLKRYLEDIDDEAEVHVPVNNSYNRATEVANTVLTAFLDNEQRVIIR
jgi:hypothetical protein